MHENPKKNFVLATVLVVLVVCLFVACGGGQTDAETTPDEAPPSDTQDDSSETAVEGDDSPGSQLVAERCVGCHDLEIVYAESYTREEWLESVNTMIERGAVLTEEERDLVVEYLASR